MTVILSLLVHNTTKKCWSKELSKFYLLKIIRNMKIYSWSFLPLDIWERVHAPPSYIQHNKKSFEYIGVIRPKLTLKRVFIYN